MNIQFKQTGRPASFVDCSFNPPILRPKPSQLVTPLLNLCHLLLFPSILDTPILLGSSSCWPFLGQVMFKTDILISEVRDLTEEGVKVVQEQSYKRQLKIVWCPILDRAQDYFQLLVYLQKADAYSVIIFYLCYMQRKPDTDNAFKKYFSLQKSFEIYLNKVLNCV